MNFANEYAIQNWYLMFNETVATPNLADAADALGRLADWANDNSDGWAYWPKPARAAAKLIKLLQDGETKYRNGAWEYDASDAELRAALTPIKSFLTRQNVNHADVIV